MLLKKLLPGEWKAIGWKTALSVFSLAGSLVILGLTGSYQGTLSCTALNITMENDEHNYFLTRDDVISIVREVAGGPVVGLPCREISIAEMEKVLDANPYVKEAEVWKELDASLDVHVELRRPLARLIPNEGESFYLDHNMSKVPVSPAFTANVILIRGPFQENLEPRDTIFDPLISGLKEFLETVDRDPLFSAMISEVVVNPGGDLVLYPELGNIPVEFGDAGDSPQKFEDIRKFYMEILNRAGWDSYSKISVKYKDQVVAVRAK